MARRARILDIWAGQAEADWSFLRSVMDADLIHGVIIRQGQGDWEDKRFAEHVQGAYDAGLPALAYHVHEPRLYTATGVLNEDKWPPIETDWQMDRLRRSLEHKALYGLAIDDEVVKEYDKKTIIPDAWLSRTARHHKAMVDKEFGGKWDFRPLYSANWFLDYSPATKVWLHQHDLWWAYYIQPKNVTALLSWEDLEQYIPDDQYWPFPECTGIIEGRKKAVLWQWTGDRFVLPGIYGEGHKITALDFSLYDGTPEEWWERIGFDPGSGPAPVDPPEEEEEPGSGGGEVDLSTIETKLDRVIELLEQQNAKQLRYE